MSIIKCKYSVYKCEYIYGFYRKDMKRYGPHDNCFGEFDGGGCGCYEARVEYFKGVQIKPSFCEHLREDFCEYTKSTNSYELTLSDYNAWGKTAGYFKAFNKLLNQSDIIYLEIDGEVKIQNGRRCDQKKET